MPVAQRVLLALLLAGFCALAAGEAGAVAAPDCTFADALRHTRPGAPAPTEVRVAVYLVDVPRIDDADQTYLADIFLRYEWTDARLAGARQTPCTVPLDAVWNPDVLVVNRRSVESLMDQVVEVQPDGRVRYVQRLYGAFSLALDLKRFPFDAQRLPVRLVARYTPDEVKLVADPALVAVSEHLSNPNWRIGAPQAVSGEYRVIPGRAIAQLEVIFAAERRSAHYVWKLIIPMSLVVFMSWAALWISPQNIPSRLGLSATSMLTLIAFRLALGSTLPPIPYLTEFDLFTIGSTMLVFAALAQAVATTALWDKERKQAAHRLNHISRLLFPAAFALVLLLSFSRFSVPL